MRSLLARTGAALFAGSLGIMAAHADVYTWTDASGRLNVSNIAPPEGVHVSRVIHEDPPKPRPTAPARDADVQALTERVAALQDEVDRTKREPPPVPVIAYGAAPSAPPVQVTVNVMPPEPAAVYSAAYPAYSGYPYPGYPGLPRDYCEPTVFGCPTAFGYPVGVVVLKTPRSHRHRFDDRFHGPQHFVAKQPVPPAMNFRRR